MTRALGPLAAALTVATLGCGEPAPGDAGPMDAGPRDASIALDAPCVERVTLAPGDARIERVLDAPCAVAIEPSGPVVVDVSVDAGLVDGAPALGPLTLDAPIVVGTSAPATLTVRVLGIPTADVAIDRSLTWTDPALLDDPAAVGLGRVLRTISDTPGALLDAWFRRFGTTAHSERLGPQRLLEDRIAEQGADPTGWDLDAFGFRVTGVHHRLDLMGDGHCGEVRVSLASTDPLHQPFHLIFLYRAEATALDVRPDGLVHCAATAAALGRLSTLSPDGFLTEARAMLDRTLRREGFLVAETVELLISPWEWRQWFLQPDGALDNRPLFQTVDTPRLNAPGPDRDEFLAWVSANADTLGERRAEIPERFRSASARVNDGVPWIPLDLTGVDPAALDRQPALRQQIELVGCPACHAIDADFVQTLPDRSFSPFYAKELEARRDFLGAVVAGEAEPPPHGPLQPDPVLPP